MQLDIDSIFKNRTKANGLSNGAIVNDLEWRSLRCLFESFTSESIEHIASMRLHTIQKM